MTGLTPAQEKVFRFVRESVAGAAIPHLTKKCGIISDSNPSTRSTST